MASSSTILDPIDDLSGASLRSRASSIVTTSRFSLETISQDDRSSIGAIWERQHRLGNNNSGRPHSITSVAHPAPPYTEAINSTLQLPTHHNGNLQGLLSRLAEVADRPAEAASLNEPLAPSTIASGDTTPAPDSPLDPELNPSTQAAYYSNVVRTLDSNFTAELEHLRQKHVQDLALTRHQIDSVYRAQWKAQNRENEKIREEAAKARDEEVQRIKAESDARVRGLEEKVRELEGALVAQAEEGHAKHEKAVEKARHEVEDLWERRWRDRARIEEEEKERAEIEWEKERAEVEREKQRVEIEREKERADIEREKELREAFKRTVEEWMLSKG
ncbi:MAG: hypothetical protein L6R42_003659 [Xanthoria sp. 1 TBL-2021]|nr:MAG: hypothetical protein L6R42_003659 [Xanthoria sp. 1 TBL-2021]